MYNEFQFKASLNPSQTNCLLKNIISECGIIIIPAKISSFTVILSQEMNTGIYTLHLETWNTYYIP